MDDIKSTIGEFAGSVAKKSSRLLRSTKLSMALSAEEQKLKNQYIEIGKKVHEIYTFGGTLGGAFDVLYKDLKDAEARIKEIKKDLAELKGIVVCPKCGASVEKGSDFCPKCGGELAGGAAPAREDPESVVSPPERAAQNVAPADSRQCPVCGRRNGSGERFCVSCGRVLN